MKHALASALSVREDPRPRAEQLLHYELDMAKRCERERMLARQIPAEPCKIAQLLRSKNLTVLVFDYRVFDYRPKKAAIGLL